MPKFGFKEAVAVGAFFAATAACTASPSEAPKTSEASTPATTATTTSNPIKPSTPTFAPESGVCTRFPELDGKGRDPRGQTVLRVGRAVVCSMPVHESAKTDSAVIGEIGKDSAGNSTLFKAICWRGVGAVASGNSMVQVQFNAADNQSSALGWVKDTSDASIWRLRDAAPGKPLMACDQIGEWHPQDVTPDPITAPGEVIPVPSLPTR